MADDIAHIQKEIANTIRMLRVQNAYTQEYVAYKLDISQNAYSKIERGMTNLDVKHIYRLADVYKVPVTSFLPAPNASNGINMSGLPEFLKKVRDGFLAVLKKKQG